MRRRGAGFHLDWASCVDWIHGMNLNVVNAAVEQPCQESIEALLENEQTVFWVDWRHEDEEIANDCEAILQTGRLSGELVETDADPGFEIYICYKDKRVKVPLTVSPQDRHITLCSLNEALAPDYEVRFCIDSNGSDTLAFLPLPTSTWAELEGRYGGRVDERFYKIASRPNLFTDPLPF